MDNTRSNINYKTESVADISAKILSNLSIEKLTESSLSFISTCNSDVILTRAQTGNMINGVVDFLNCQFINDLKQLILLNANKSMVNVISEKIESVQSIFKDFNTEYKRIAFLKKQKLYIEPKSVHFGPQPREKKGKEETVNVGGQLVPLDSVLKRFLELPNVFDETYKYYCDLINTSDSITNIIQTEFWKKNVEYKENSIIFPLHIFEDAFETGNPLGPNAGKHKLNGVYASIACLPPEQKSKLNNIFSLQIYYVDDLHNFNRKEIFSDMIILLNKLDTEGITLELKENRIINVRFKVANIIADNLGLNGILGFQESFSANHFCRICKLHKTETKKRCHQVDKSLRNLENYKKDLEIRNSEKSGIKEACVFHDLIDFHCTVNISVDVMHDILEGICRVEMFHVVHHCLKVAKYFSLKTLNHRLTFFRFKDSENRPPLITETDIVNKKLKMTASQMLAFVLNFGLMVGDLITKRNDEFWKLYKLQREILSVALQNTIENSTPALFEKLVMEHHTLYIKLI